MENTSTLEMYSPTSLFEGENTSIFSIHSFSLSSLAEGESTIILSMHSQLHILKVKIPIYSPSLLL